MITIDTEVLKDILAIAGVVIAAFLSHYLSFRKLRKESIEGIERYKYEAILRAHQEVYKLLRYMTSTENKDSILVWKKNENNEKEYSFRLSNLEKFIDEIPIVIYQCGNGIFLSKKVMSLLFEYRNIVYGLRLRTENLNSDSIKIDENNIALRMIRIHDDFAKSIREAIDIQRRDLVFTSKGIFCKRNKG